MVLEDDEAVVVTEERTEPHDDACDDSEENEGEWGKDVYYFENIMNSLQQYANVYPVLIHEDTEVDYFLSVFTKEILEIIKDQTNLYVTQEYTTQYRGQETRMPSKNWQPTTVKEIKTFIGVHILMGIHFLPELRHYWSSDPFLGVTPVAELTTKAKVKDLTENIHSNDNSKAMNQTEPGYDRLHKLPPIFHALNSHLREAYVPSSVMVVENMVPFKGRSSIK
ncbi:uncharacterized protein LOC126084126 [Elephas maximus indicus]|uniref:uncharacterized protein LOC126084126 n=1 Tax=Elephas maximus indicus TaxID=99487 RepID=UPI002115D141|nr:uncharacterized protein LOC126084126 [Elephas maximus indicus]